VDARVYFALQDAIDYAASVADLRATRDLLVATTMHPTERRVLERRLREREARLRSRDIAVERPLAERGD